MSAAQTSTATDRLTASVDRLIKQVAHWQAGRWAAGLRAGAATADGAGSGGDTGPVTSRGDRVYALVQRLADLAADAEGRPRRTVPRLGDLVLPDQAQVMANDLIAAGAPEQMLQTAAEEVDEARRTL